MPDKKANPRKVTAKPARSDRFRQTAERIANLMENPDTPAEVVSRVREAICEEIDAILLKLDIHHPRFIRELYPLLREFKAAHLCETK